MTLLHGRSRQRSSGRDNKQHSKEGTDAVSEKGKVRPYAHLPCIFQNPVCFQRMSSCSLLFPTTVESLLNLRERHCHPHLKNWLHSIGAYIGVHQPDRTCDYFHRSVLILHSAFSGGLFFPPFSGSAPVCFWLFSGIPHSSTGCSR